MPKYYPYKVYGYYLYYTSFCVIECMHVHASDSQLSERFDSLRETAKQLGDLNEKAQEARETAGTVLEWLKGLYRKAADVDLSAVTVLRLAFCSQPE